MPLYAAVLLGLINNCSAVLIRGINGQTFPQLVEAHQAKVISETRTLKFYYEPSKVVGEQASEETISKVATDLLEFLERSEVTVEAEIDGYPPIMFFAYDFGGIILKQVEKNHYLLIVRIKADWAREGNCNRLSQRAISKDPGSNQPSGAYIRDFPIREAVSFVVEELFADNSRASRYSTERRISLRARRPGLLVPCGSCIYAIARF
jgi:hypothetical protein